MVLADPGSASVAEVAGVVGGAGGVALTEGGGAGTMGAEGLCAAAARESRSERAKDPNRRMMALRISVEATDVLRWLFSESAV
ncbi:MAG: hypothetical protein NVSMB62_09740 [Acidobacteriaceae bacterium]